jgi:hypothetical protein
MTPPARLAHRARTTNEPELRTRGDGVSFRAVRVAFFAPDVDVNHEVPADEEEPE